MITIAILHGQIQRITGAGKKISCTDGQVWVTQDGFREDRVLQSGESLVVKTAGLTLVNAIVDATIVIENGVAEGRRTLSEPAPKRIAPPATDALTASIGLFTELQNQSIHH